MVWTRKVVKSIAPMRMVLIHKTGITDAWRSHPELIAKNNLKAMFPGLGTALVLFAGYVALDQLLWKTPKGHGHGHGHGKEHGKEHHH